MTAIELGEQLGVSRELIRHYMNRLRITGTVQKVNGRPSIVITDSQAKRIIEYYEENSFKSKPENETVKKEPKGVTPEMRAAHPLVTDDRCFNFNWWPKVTILDFERWCNDEDYF